MDDKSKGFLPRGLKRVVEETTPTVTINTNVKIQSLIDSHLIYDGQVSKRHYEWMKAGAVVEVDESDVPELIAKRLGKKSCCGRERTKIIQLAE
jgi:hypothetical protein